MSAPCKRCGLPVATDAACEACAGRKLVAEVRVVDGRMPNGRFTPGARAVDAHAAKARLDALRERFNLQPPERIQLAKLADQLVAALEAPPDLERARKLAAEISKALWG